jgi:hypothetical protein
LANLSGVFIQQKFDLLVKNYYYRKLFPDSRDRINTRYSLPTATGRNSNTREYSKLRKNQNVVNGNAVLLCAGNSKFILSMMQKDPVPLMALAV